MIIIALAAVGGGRMREPKLLELQGWGAPKEAPRGVDLPPTELENGRTEQEDRVRGIR